MTNGPAKEQSFLVDLWAKKHDRLESKDARICREIKINFGTKKTVEKCHRKIKHLIDNYKDAKTWNKTQNGGQLRKSVFCDKINRVLRTRNVGTLKHVVEAGTHKNFPTPIPTSPVAAGSSSGTPSPQPSTRGTSGTTPAEPGKSRREQQREKYLKMEKMKRELYSRGASNRLKSRANS